MPMNFLYWYRDKSRGINRGDEFPCVNINNKSSRKLIKESYRNEMMAAFYGKKIFEMFKFINFIWGIFWSMFCAHKTMWSCLCIVFMRKEKWRQKLLKFLVLFRGKIYNLRSNNKTKVLLHQAESSILEFIYIYIYIRLKLNQTVLELDFRAVKFLFFPRRYLNSHHWYTAAPFA